MDNVRPWLRLKNTPGIGNLLGRRLIDHFKSPQRIFQASAEELTQIEGLTGRHAGAILTHRTPAGVDAELELADRKGYQIITLTDKNYPQWLHRIPDPPLFLYVSGQLNSSAVNIAIVGSRNATGYGLDTTQRLSSDLASLGMTVVSGMARGIDTAAHQGALAGGGETIAVLGSGLENIYPAENRKLFRRISERGAVISEFPLFTKPEAHNFPVRNRIISGMSMGTVVVEATKKSGSLITARLAVEQNREVFAVPGSIQSFKSAGTHTLIKQGAKLVEHARDIIEEIAPMIPQANTSDTTVRDAACSGPAGLTPDERLIYDALGPYPTHIDDISRSISMQPGKLSSILLKLELDGLVQQSPGKFFTLKPDRSN